MLPVFEKYKETDVKTENEKIICLYDFFCTILSLSLQK
jgi:hypothetical protein